MDLSEAFWYVGFGGIIGFILGYIVRALQEIKEELDVVEKAVGGDRDRNEQGFVMVTKAANIALLVVVLLTVWAAFASQRASNDVEETQDTIAAITVCNQQFLEGTLAAVNERTTYSSEQAQANIDLQESQAVFVDVLQEDPPPTSIRQQRAIRVYSDALDNYLDLQQKTAENIADNPYPTPEALQQCLENEME